MSSAVFSEVSFYSASGASSLPPAASVFSSSTVSVAASSTGSATGTVAANYAAWFAPENTALQGGLICVNSTGQGFFDREEQSRTSGAVFSPGTVSQTRFCGETSVLSFADTGNSVLAASVARQNVAAGSASGPFTNGWSVIDTTNSFQTTLGPTFAAAGSTTTTGTNSTAYTSQAGLPILGASFIKLTNPQAAAGTVGTYGITWPHRFTK